MKLTDLVNKKIIIYQNIEIDPLEVIKCGVKDGFDDEDIINYIYELLCQWGMILFSSKGIIDPEIKIIEL